MDTPVATDISEGQLGRCPECLTLFNLGVPPEGTDVTQLPCRALIGTVGNQERVFVGPFATPTSYLRTEQGLTPVRPCTGVLEIVDQAAA